jgi:hypothetical protein
MKLVAFGVILIAVSEILDWHTSSNCLEYFIHLGWGEGEEVGFFLMYTFMSHSVYT